MLACALALHKEWRARYTVLYQLPQPGNLLKYLVSGIVDTAVTPVLASSAAGLPNVRVYVPKKALAQLESDLPESIKDWQRALLIYPNGKLERMKFRFRGDNPVNWAYAKKSFRIKLRKKRMIENTRVFNYMTPQSPGLVEDYLAYSIAATVGIPVPKARLVEVLVNDVPAGIYIEAEHLDENFLRNRGIMPVDIFKGEQNAAEHKFMTDHDLFDNPDLWTKTSVFNQKPKDDNSILAEILELVRRAETSSQALDALHRRAPLDAWARFSAYQTLVQSWHNDFQHNMRIIADPWRGKAIPVSHDTGTDFAVRGDFQLDRATHALFDVYSRDSRFLSRKYRILYGFIEDGVLANAAAGIRNMIPALKNSYERDRTRYRMTITRGALASLPSGLATVSGMKSHWLRTIDDMTALQSAIKSTLEADPDLTWFDRSGGIHLVIAGQVPAGAVSLLTAPGAPVPETFAWDADGNGEIGPGDVPIPFSIADGRIVLAAEWFANRFGSRALNPAATEFALVADKPLTIEGVRAGNPLTGKSVDAKRDPRRGVTPARLNAPVVEPAPQTPTVWQGEKIVEKTLVIDGPLTIAAGTTIKMAPGASLVLRGKTMVDGTAANPVRIHGASGRRPWGVFALSGPGAAHSRISHLHVAGGSGEWVDGVSYIGMVSVHDTHDIHFIGLHARDNRRYDDMIHTIYSHNIRFDDCHLDAARSDAFDFDLSGGITISNCTIANAGNDALDFMGTAAMVRGSRLLSSSDKAVSAGEGSNILVFNSLLEKNYLGIVVKDGSSAYVVNSDLVGNASALNAYQKNWRYGSGGRLMVEKSKISDTDPAYWRRYPLTPAITDKRSTVNVADTLLPVSLAKRRDGISIDDASRSASDAAAATPIGGDVAAALKRWRLDAKPDVRGRFE